MLILIPVAWNSSKWAQEEYPETTGQGLNKQTEKQPRHQAKLHEWAD